MTRVLVTGGTGFIGAALVDKMNGDAHFDVSASVRAGRTLSGVYTHQISDLNAETNWLSALEGVDVVVHTAARVHVMHDSSTDPLTEFRKVNVEGTLNLARQAARSGVQRFVFLSSIKVNGEGTPPGRPYKPDDLPDPKDYYGISKMEAEIALRELAELEHMEVVIIRPVLVYGPGVKANFLSMIRWLNRGVPLPLGSIHNKRSLVSLDNLINMIITCIDHPSAANQVFLVSDGEDLSTTQLLVRISKALNKPSRLIPVPSRILELFAGLLGKRDFSRRLCGSLQVDIAKNRELLNWTPQVSVDQALSKTVNFFLEQDK
ncbi:NAD-dependent epimerase/dehydratase family protein [Pseudomonas sp. PA-3-5D]|uniref:UDP-glucose 4-epimerase family protein n=2 Tax=Pseudomonas TaxID=286 RepID=UPI001F22DA33|nr:MULTISPECIES: SDR family oxidoreductase [unclassified Pseudomonas]MCF5510816.1 NAD-dependent epimerase/dehydratase family protein [Pseudomonas sp. PA-3-6H]MCF5561403.1 NAD-dependent epimerase/dehydratase family protein [Pseudomonas sp. PA-3-5D]